MASSETTITFGANEKITFPELELFSVIAKIDTGAYSGAIHCSSIKVIKKKNGKKLLRFIVANNDRLVEFSKYRRAYVRSSMGHRIKRYLIETEAIIKREKYKLIIGLSDRSDMQCEVLIGRRFLGEHGILVDVRINNKLDNEMKVDKE